MTENKAILIMQMEKQCVLRNIQGCDRNCKKRDLLKPDKEILEGYDMAISALKAIQQYREIGTVEECREAVGKQKPKKPLILVSRGGKGGKYCICPRCEAVTGKHIPFCRLCGQAIDWSNEDERD